MNARVTPGQALVLVVFAVLIVAAGWVLVAAR